MGGIALLARAMGHQVSGSDANVYPPMSTQLQDAGIALMEGYSADNIADDVDIVVIGNALSRGNPEVEHILNTGLTYTSGPAWLSEHILRGRWVLAVAGTHGKTTTSSILTWLLEDAGLNPGFLIGGVAENFGVSARLGEAPFFVVEADEYDTAFFDKRSKFVHYHPNTLVLNNLEFDHADIFPDIAAIQRQFHHVVRTVPGNGKLIVNGEDTDLDEVLEQGCWSAVDYFGTAGAERDCEWTLQQSESGKLKFVAPSGDTHTAVWSMIGKHNAFNAMAAVAAAYHAGVPLDVSTQSLANFQGVKRRLQVRGCVKGVTVYDDFAHHPTAIKATLEGLKSSVSAGRIIAVIELRSNSMRMGVHLEQLPQSFAGADEVLVNCPEGPGSERLQVLTENQSHVQVLSRVGCIVSWLLDNAQNQDHIVIMSNGAFGGIHNKVINGLTDKCM